IWVIDTYGVTLYTNDRMAGMLGLSSEEMVGMQVLDLMIDDVGRPTTSPVSDEQVAPSNRDFQLRKSDGSHIWVSIGTNPMFDKDGVYVGALGMVADITERKQAEDALQNEKDNLAAIFASSPVGMLLLDEETMIVDANSVMANMVSRNLEQIINQRGGGGLGCAHSFENEKGCGFSPACVDCSLRQGITQVIKDGISIHGAEIQTTLVIQGQERHPWLRVSAEPITISGRKHVIVAIDDITERKLGELELVRANLEIDTVNRELVGALSQANQFASEAEQAREEIAEHAVELSHQATHDSLTGLPNRQYFEQHLGDLIERSAGKKTRSMTVLFLDLDKFKQINDTLGHKIGDLLLIETGQRLQDCLRSEDILARMGGDEFTVILPRCNQRSIAQKVASRMIDSLSRPFEIQGHKFVIGASIGLASYPSDGTDTVSLLKHADAAMYKAKQSGRGTFCWFSGEVDVENQRRADLEMDIRSALGNNQFRVYYQPIVGIEDTNSISAEALLRWEHPEKGMMSPSLFIPVAEDIGVIGQIGDYVLRTACAQTKAWSDEGIHLSKIGVNVSPRQVRDATWLDSVRSALSDTGLEAERLNLEVTETDFASDYESMKETLLKVSKLGICMAIDDFGMGQSSLSRLRD
ncbi:MAG: diguanylate cyclase, partial [Armatimonadota bacterium]